MRVSLAFGSDVRGSLRDGENGMESTWQLGARALPAPQQEQMAHGLRRVIAFGHRDDGVRIHVLLLQ